MQWVWSDSAPMTVAWKSAYSLTGIFDNWSTAPITVLRATLVENDVTDMTTNQLQTLDLGPVSIRTSTGTVAFNQITQSWPWFDDVTFVMNLPYMFTKSFTYQVQLNAQDLWGNEYQLASPLKSVSVFIPQSKLTDCGLAATSAGMGAFFLAAAASMAAVAAATPPPADIPLFEAAAGLFAAGGAAYATAQVLGSAAKDPPAPDPLYKESVQKKAVEIPADLSGNPLADALANFYRLVLDIAADHYASYPDHSLWRSLRLGQHPAVPHQHHPLRCQATTVSG